MRINFSIIVGIVAGDRADGEKSRGEYDGDIAVVGEEVGINNFELIDRVGIDDGAGEGEGE